MYRQTDRHTDRQTDRHTDTQTDTQTDRQRHRQTHRQTDRYTYKELLTTINYLKRRKSICAFNATIYSLIHVKEMLNNSHKNQSTY